MVDFLPALRLFVVVLHHNNVAVNNAGFIDATENDKKNKWQEVDDDPSRRGRQRNREHKQKESLQCKSSLRRKSVNFFIPLFVLRFVFRFLHGHSNFSENSIGHSLRDDLCIFVGVRSRDRSQNHIVSTRSLRLFTMLVYSREDRYFGKQLSIS